MFQGEQCRHPRKKGSRGRIVQEAGWEKCSKDNYAEEDRKAGREKCSKVNNSGTSYKLEPKMARMEDSGTWLVRHEAYGITTLPRLDCKKGKDRCSANGENISLAKLFNLAKYRFRGRIDAPLM